MALDFNPYPILDPEQYRRPSFDETVNKPIQMGLQGLVKNQEQNRLREREEMDRQRLEDDRRLQTLKLAMDEGLDPSVIDEYLNNPNAGRAPKRILSPMQNPRPILSSNRLNLPADFQSSPDVPSFPMGTKRIQAQEDRDLSRRKMEAEIQKLGREPNNLDKQPTSVEAYLMREVQGGRMTLEDAIAKINQAKPPKSEQPMSPENAGKLSMATSAIGDVDTVINSLFDKNGRVDRARLFSANFSIPFMRGGIPFTQGRGIDSAIENAIAAKLRAETGAAATPEEIRHVSNRFRPNLRDDDMTIKNKLLRLRSALAGGVELADPSGAYRERQGSIPPPPEVIDRVGLSVEEENELEELEKMFGGGM